MIEFSAGRAVLAENQHVGVFLDHLREIVRLPIKGAAGFSPIAGPKSYITASAPAS